MALQSDTIQGITGRHILFSQLIVGLSHCQCKEVSDSLLWHGLRIINELFLYLFIFQRFNLTVPTKCIIPQQALLIAHPDRHTGILGRFRITEVAHKVKLRIYIESTACPIQILPDAQSATGTEHLLYRFWIPNNPINTYFDIWMPTTNCHSQSLSYAANPISPSAVPLRQPIKDSLWSIY